MSAITDNISREFPVLVTGASGFIASFIVKELLDKGFIVHGTTRDITQTHKYQHLFELCKDNNKNKQLKMFECQFNNDKNWKHAFKNCKYVFHTGFCFALLFFFAFFLLFCANSQLNFTRKKNKSKSNAN